LYLLLAQFGAKDRKAIPADSGSLKMLCFGEMPGPKVLAKFEEVIVDGQKCLRNNRMAEEWDIAKEEYEAKKRGAELGANRSAEQDAQRTTERSGERSAKSDTERTPSRNQDPGPTNQELGSQDSKPTTDSVDVVLAKFLKVFNAAYSRDLKAAKLNDKAMAHLKGLVRAYGPGGTCCLAILAYVYDASANNPDKRIKTRAISDLFHDGTNSTFEWSKLLQTAGSLPPAQAARALEIAESVGLSEALREVGVNG
jgi:hypothetical protein